MILKDELKVFRPYEVDGLQRMGNKNDGGYVVHTPSLKLADCLVTYGVGYNVNFEEDFHEATHKPVYAFDPTLMKMKYLAEDLKNGSYGHFLSQSWNWLTWIGKEEKLRKKDIYFIREGIAENDSAKEFKTLGYHLNKYDLLDKKLFLKIDIEGAEYKVMKDPSFFSYMDNVVQMVYEFHWLDSSLHLLIPFINRLAKTHSLVHIHANNFGSTFDYHGVRVPHVVEATFLHNALMPEQKKVSNRSYPIPGLDAPCTTKRAELIPDFF